MRTRARWAVTVGISALSLISGRRVAAQDQRTAVLNAERVFYPFAKTLFLAFDLIFRPPSPEDFN